MLSFTTMCLTLFLIIDAFGNVSSFVDILHPLEQKKYYRKVSLEMLIALGLMLLFDVCGPWLIATLSLSEVTVWLGSGLVLFLFALSVLYPSEKSPRISSKRHEEPFIVPLATPLVAGPSLLATIILFSSLVPDMSLRMSAILLAWGLSALILLFARTIQRWIGVNGLLALERLFALVLVIMAIQRIMIATRLFVTTYL